MVSNEDYTLIQRYIILNTVRKALEMDYTKIEQLATKFKPFYLAQQTLILDQVSKDLMPIKKSMQKKHIKIGPLRVVGLFSEYQFHINGYEQTNKILNVHLRNQAFDYIKTFYTK
ncbi:hypothetical protein [Alkalihalobacillus pseudalcaliphilus]|uniref:hypothetical protein n=1 Tax=Alkalihalobacillus pseudalcaliphilus TaxID=79884 RepID=UPI00064DE02E|nr:hypothetical protein [Alkalihalobacillus pseudalcaliphilus]KMK74739.1 hypothetical protein AB990_19840 [Alkalihalobacillus pseudalcaliphilus]